MSSSFASYAEPEALHRYVQDTDSNRTGNITSSVIHEDDVDDVINVANGHAGDITELKVSYTPLLY